jgi:hypothetical protein
LRRSGELKQSLFATAMRMICRNRAAKRFKSLLCRRLRVLRNCRVACWVIGIVLSAGAASVQAQSNLDAGKSPAQIFSDTCNACHRSPREIKRTSPAFLREHYTTGLREATAMAAYLASVGSDPQAVQQRRPPVMGAGQAGPAESAAARAPAVAPQATDQSKSDTQAALPATTAPLPPEQARQAATGARPRRPSESVEFGVPSSWATAGGASPQTAAMPSPKRYPGQDIEE